MIEIISKLQSKYPDYKHTKNDADIIDKCIDGIYTEDDFMTACENLFKTTSNKSIYIFKDKNIFIRYKNMFEVVYPEWFHKLSFDAQNALKFTYVIIAKYCFYDLEIYNCNYPKVLELIYEYHKKEAIPYYCISAVVEEQIDNYKHPISEVTLLSFMNEKEKFKQMCREIYKRQETFKKKAKNIYDIGKKI